MQGLLSRLKGLSDQNRQDKAPVKPEERGGKNNLLINNFVKNGDVTGQSDKILQNGINHENTDYISEPGSARTDDGFAIDVVMSTNDASTRLLNRHRTPSPRMSVRSRKTRGSRTSLNSTSEKEDASEFESDDESVMTPKPQTPSSAQAWAMFEESMKNIDCSNPELFTKKPKPTFVSSGDFQQVMVDMYGNVEYGCTKGYTLLKQKLHGIGRTTNMAKRMLSSAIAKGAEEREREEEELAKKAEEEAEVMSHEEESGADKVTQGLAKRGWKVLKRQVNETKLEKKTDSKKMNWTMIQHTVKQMSNVERTRQDLYERYGIVPTVLEDGTTVCENRMLSERARAQLQFKDAKRPMSHHPLPSHLRSQSHSALSRRSRGSSGVRSTAGFRASAKLPHIAKQRPFTAVR